MNDFVTNEQVISDKALNYVSGLTARYEAGLIDELALRTGIEAMWALLGGVIETPLFAVVTQEANAYLSDVPQSVMTRIYQSGETIVILQRRDEVIDVTTASYGGHSIRETFAPDIAAEFVMKLHDHPDNAWNR